MYPKFVILVSKKTFNYVLYIYFLSCAICNCQAVVENNADTVEEKATFGSLIDLNQKRLIQ